MRQQRRQLVTADGGGPATSLLAGLNSFYSFESGGAMGTDAAGNGHTLALTGTVAQSAGHSPPGANASTWTDSGGVSPLGTLQGNYNHITTATSFTVTCWAYVLTGTWNTTPYNMALLGNFQAGADQWELWLRQTTKEFYFELSGGGAGGPTAEDGGGAISFSTWYFLRAQWNYSTGMLGISRNNGALIETALGFAEPYGSPTTFVLGSDGHGAGHTMCGRLDAVGTWNRLLTPAETAYLYNAGVGREMPFS